MVKDMALPFLKMLFLQDLKGFGLFPDRLLGKHDRGLIDLLLLSFILHHLLEDLGELRNTHIGFHVDDHVKDLAPEYFAVDVRRLGTHFQEERQHVL